RQHTGIFRDATTDEYYVFAQYQAGDMDSSPRSNNIDISDSSFILGNINAAIFKGTVSADSVTTTNLTASGTVNFSGATVDDGGTVTTVDIDGGTIDGTTIATSDITVGSSKTLNVSGGTLTLANDQISGDKVEGGTINSITINTLASTKVDVTNFTADSGHFETVTADSAVFSNLTATEFNVTNMAVDSGHFETVTADSALVTNIKATGTIDFSEGTVSEMFLADGSKINFGGENDLEISHNGSNSFIRETGTGSLFIDAGNFFVRTVGGNKYFSGEANIASLYHTNIERLSTTSTGVSVNGGIVADSATSSSVLPIRVDSARIVPDTDNTYDIGSATYKYKDVYATLFRGTATEAYYADLAENYVADADYEPGTVLVFGGENEVTQSTDKLSNKVAGVVSTNPAYLMNSHLEAENVTAVALTGRVPCKVIGKVEKGDMLVTSAIPGYAIASSLPQIGTVIGKALENKDDLDKGVIEIVVGRL
ncbi:MAG: hypothetical protein VW270_29815, partial [Candidatus Poseidoniales archaeon]